MEGETVSALAQIAPERKEEAKGLSNKELKEKKGNNKKEEAEYVDPTANMTEEERAIAMRRQAEESDMKQAEQLYGNVNELETMAVITDKDYQKFGKLLGMKGHTLYTPKSKQYKLMVKECMRELVADLSGVDVKELSSYMEVLFNQTVQAEKEAEKKRKKNSKKTAPKATLGKKINESIQDQLDDDDSYYDNVNDDDDYDYDFM